ncbi:MAG: hypothetical protein NTZ33_13805 [Bacteroidetes bacterium]|nr:hypothetical protein [Bacteroidota bacterium]
MAASDVLKTFFETGKRPTQDQFYQLIDFIDRKRSQIFTIEEGQTEFVIADFDITEDFYQATIAGVDVSAYCNLVNNIVTFDAAQEYVWQKIKFINIK